MRSRTFVYVACAPHPRAGTTLTARLLAAYFRSAGRPFLGFDTNPQDRAFASHDAHAEVVDLGISRGRVRLFDALVVPDGVPKVVDLWHPAYRAFLSIADDVGFLDEAGRVGVVPVMLYHVDLSAPSLRACRDLAAHWPGAEIALVHNEGAVRLGADATGHLRHYPAEHGFRVPDLGPDLAAALDMPELSFADLVQAGGEAELPQPLAALHAWLLAVFDQFRIFELRHSLEDAEYLW